MNAKVMKDPPLRMCDPKDMPFDVKRMVYGGSRSWLMPQQEREEASLPDGSGSAHLHVRRTEHGGVGVTRPGAS